MVRVGGFAWSVVREGLEMDGGRSVGDVEGIVGDRGVDGWCRVEGGGGLMELRGGRAM